jgi:hypothetical protein
MRATDLAFIDVIEKMENVGSFIKELENTPASPKRDHALELLREQLGYAIGRLNEIESDSHSN